MALKGTHSVLFCNFQKRKTLFWPHLYSNYPTVLHYHFPITHAFIFKLANNDIKCENLETNVEYICCAFKILPHSHCDRNIDYFQTDRDATTAPASAALGRMWWEFLIKIIQSKQCNTLESNIVLDYTKIYD